MNALCGHSHEALFILGPISFHWTVTVYLVEKSEGFFGYHYCYYTYFDRSVGSHIAQHHYLCVYVLYSFVAKGFSVGLLESIMTGLGSPAPIGVDHICDKARLAS